MPPYRPSRPSRPQAGLRTAIPPASATTTVTPTRSSTTDPASGLIIPSDGHLRLRGEATEPQEPARRIRWAEDVVNNEGMGKKSSKVCCIYHKPREIGESSSEDSSSSDDDSDSDLDDGAARPANRRSIQHQHDHGDDPCEDGTKSYGHNHSRAKNGDMKSKKKPSSNAYEKQPKVNPMKEKGEA